MRFFYGSKKSRRPFLDILGYSNLLTNCVDLHTENAYLEKIHGLMSHLSKYIEARNSAIDQQGNSLNLSRFKSLLFSDNILFFAPYDDETDLNNLYMNLLYGLSAFLQQYTKGDIFFRGGISKGNLFYDEKLHFVFGSGLVKAASLEKRANYPRIAIDEELNPSPILVGITQDEDKMWYLDYLSLGYSLMNSPGSPQQYHEHFLSCLGEQQFAITNALHKNKDNDYILKKYQWLAKYHNDFCKRNNLTDLLIEFD